MLTQNADWFALFRDFPGYVQFFHLQDLVTDDHSVRFFLPFNGFTETALITTPDDYMTYRKASMQFVKCRAQRMVGGY